MANVTNQRVGGDTNTMGSSVRRVEIVTKEIDIAEAVADGLATTQLIQVLKVPANTYVEVLQAINASELDLGGSPDVEFGDTIYGGLGDDDRYVAAMTSEADGNVHTLTASAGGFMYNLPAMISAKITGDDLVSGKIRYCLRITNTNEAEPYSADWTR